MKNRIFISVLFGLAVFTLLTTGCLDKRSIPGNKVITIYNSEMQETKTLAPLDTMYVKVSALTPGKTYEISVKDSDGKLVSKIQGMTDADGVIGPAALWFDIGLTKKDANSIPVLEKPDSVDIIAFKINVKSVADSNTDFSQDMWIRYKKVATDTNPKPVVYACYTSDNTNYYLENAFEESGSKKDDGITDSDKVKIYVKADRVPTRISGNDVSKVDFYIIPFTGDIIQDGFKLNDPAEYIVKKTDVAVMADPSDSNNKIVSPTLLWDLNSYPKIINPTQDNMAYSIIMDVDQDGVYDAGIDTNSDGVSDSYIDGSDGLGVPGFIVQNTPANDTFITIKDGTSADSNIVNSIPESGVDTENLYFNMYNIILPSGSAGKIDLYLVDTASLSDGSNIPADVRSGGKTEITVSAASDDASGLQLLPYVEGIKFFNTNQTADAYTYKTLPITADKKLDLVVDVDQDGVFDKGVDTFLSDSITLLDVIPNPDYATCSDADGTNKTKFFDETNTENGNTVVYLKPSNQTGSYKVYLLKDREWNDQDYIVGEILTASGTGNDVIKVWDLNSDYKVINPDIENNTFNLVMDNDEDGIYDAASDDIVKVVILNTKANAYPRVSYVNIASGGSFGNTRSQHWTVYSEYCDYRDVFSVNATDTNPRGGYGVKAVFNPYFKWFSNNNPENEIESIYYGKYVDLYIVSKDKFDLSNYGNAGELTDTIDARGAHSTIAVQPSCYNGAGMMTVWPAPLTKGDYYVIVDVNQNGRIDEGTDIIDAVNKSNETVIDDASIVGFSVN